MKYKELGRTGLKVSVLGIGGGAFYGPNKTHEKVRKVIEYGVNHGVNFIETAEEYDETKIGNALKNVNKDLIIASKSCSHTPDTMKRSLGNSIEKIGRNIDIYMLQTIMTSNQLKKPIENGTLDVLKDAKRDGTIGHIGITGHRIPTLIEAIKTDEFDVVEVPYSIGQYKSEELFKVANKFNVGVIAITPLAGGLLIDRDGNSPASNLMNTGNVLAYVVSNNNVSTALVGMSSVEHIKENIAAVERGVNISQGERAEIERKVLEFLGEDFCRSCKACMPCDKYGWEFSIDNFLRFKTFYLKYGIDAFIEEYWRLRLKANDCIKCGKCIERCPYGINIIEELEETHKIFKEKLDDVLDNLIEKINDKQKEVEKTLKDVKGHISNDLYNELLDKSNLDSIQIDIDTALKKDKEYQVKELRKVLDKIHEIKHQMDNTGGIREKIEESRETTEYIYSISKEIQDKYSKILSNPEIVKKITTVHNKVKQLYKKKNIENEELIKEYVRLNKLHQHAIVEEDPIKKGKMMDDVLMGNIKILQKIKFSN